MKRLLVMILGTLLLLLGSTAVASPGNVVLLGTTLLAVPPPTVSVTVAHAGAGAGTTTPDIGVYPMVVGAPVTLSAFPNLGSYFGGWVVDVGGSPVLTENLYVLSSTVPGVDVRATATFTTSGFTLKTDTRGDGAVDPPAGNYNFSSGLTVLLTATASGLLPFSHWENGTGANLGSTNPLSVTMDSDQARTAVFAVPITGGIVINGNRSTTNVTAVTLALTWAGGNGAGVTRMRFSDDGAHWSLWEPVNATRDYTLPSGEGYRTVRVQYRDVDGNYSAAFSDYIRLDKTPPTGTITINNGASVTYSPGVLLNLTSNDGTGSGVARMRFSDDGAHWSPWETFATSRPYTLPASSGHHTVRVQYRDAAGNSSVAYNDYINLLIPGK